MVKFVVASKSVGQVFVPNLKSHKQGDLYVGLKLGIDVVEVEDWLAEGMRNAKHPLTGEILYKEVKTIPTGGKKATPERQITRNELKEEGKIATKQAVMRR